MGSRHAAIVILILTLAMPDAAAVLDGKSINLTYYAPDLNTPLTRDPPYTFNGTVPTTFNGVITQFNMSVTDTNILINFTGPFSWDCCIPFNGWVLTVTDGTPIASVKVNPATTIRGFTLRW